jgi:GT2 family glycosyltransferase
MTSYVSVVIPHLNQLSAARRCLESLRDQSYDANQVEIIMVDNGSSVSLAPLHSAFPNVRYLSETRPGPGHARNAGVKVASGDIVAFIDADCRAHPQWIATLVAALADSTGSGVVGGDVRIDCANPNVMTGLEAYESVFAYRQKMYIEKLQFSGTGNLAVRKDVFTKVGTFGGIAVAEDRDWGRRAAASGHPVRYVPDMIVWHPARTSFSDMQDKWRRHVAHDLFDYRATHKPIFGWWLRSLAVALSSVTDMGRVISSRRVSGLINKFRAAAILIRVRGFRCVEMIRQSRTDGNSAAASWNRS